MNAIYKIATLQNRAVTLNLKGIPIVFSLHYICNN